MAADRVVPPPGGVSTTAEGATLFRPAQWPGRPVSAIPLKVVVVGPQWSGPVLAHGHRVNVDTNDVRLLIRTLVDGKDDIAAVVQLQKQMRSSQVDLLVLRKSRITSLRLKCQDSSVGGIRRK